MEKSNFTILAYTGRPVDTWFGRLAFDLAGMTTKPRFPILREHGRDRVVGVGEKSWTDKAGFHVSGRFLDTAEGREVKALAAEDFPWQASVGIWPVKVKTLAEGENAVVNGHKTKGPGEIWQESRVGEISFVSLGADSDTEVVVFSATGTEGGQDFMAYVQTVKMELSCATGTAIREARRRRPDLHAAMLKGERK